MAIKYVNVINSFVSTEGSGGFMTNYVYYTLLVVNTDGTTEIAEGKLNQVSYLLPFVRTPVDELRELKETVRGLRQDISDMVDQKMTCVVDSLYPIPPIQGLNEVEALQQLELAGLKPIFVNTYPEDTPKNGVVHALKRNPDNFKEVFLLIIHPMPEVNGLQLDEAMAKLQAAGFTADVKHRVVSGVPNGQVLSCTRPDDNKLRVVLDVCDAVPETRDMHVSQACQILQAAGYTVTTEKKFFTAAAPDIVMGWSDLGNKRIKLIVSIPPVYKAQYVDVKWNETKDFAGDDYAALAEFDNNTQTLSVKLSYSLGGKSKREITAIDCAIGADAPDLDIWVMDPKDQGVLIIKLPFGKPFEELPQTVAFDLDVQYDLVKGIMKLSTTMSFRFTFEW
jgi:hypothetical protein